MTSTGRELTRAFFFIGALCVISGLALLAPSLLSTGGAIGRSAPKGNGATIPPLSHSAGFHQFDLYNTLPIGFEANQGQENPSVKFLARGRNYRILFTDESAICEFAGDTEGSPSITLTLLNANAHHLTGLDKLPGASNYFVGRDPSKWKTGIANYSRLKYEQAFPGVDLVYYGTNRQLEYDAIVQPGAFAPTIKWAIGTADLRGRGRISADGDFLLSIGNRELRLRRPIAYQREPGATGRREIEAKYVLSSAATPAVDNVQQVVVAIQVGDYDHSKELVIDPVLTFSTYLGGSSNDVGKAIAIDNAGNVYIAGGTFSSDFPALAPIQSSLHGSNGDAFITKINAAGSAILYSTYLGGSFSQQASGITVDPNGNAYVVGQTASADFPVTPGAFETSCTTCGSSAGVAFISKLDPTGSQLVYSTYLGGTGGDATGDRGDAIAVDTSGSAYVTGGSFSSDFPTTPGVFQTSRVGGPEQVFVSKLNASGSALSYSTYLGAGEGFGIAVNASGNAYVAGATSSAIFPTTAGAFQTIYGGPGGSAGDAFITQLNANGSALVYSTFLGGSQDDYAGGIGIDSAGNAYVAGQTLSTDFPIANAFQSTLNGPADAYVAKLSQDGSAIMYSTYLGGSGDDDADTVAVDSLGNAYASGFTQSSDFPLIGALQSSFGGGVQDAFLTAINPQGTPFFSTFLGGTISDQGNGIAVDSSGNAYLTGSTQSTDFPVFAPIQSNLATNSNTSCSPGPCPDVFVAKIAVLENTPPADFSLVASPTSTTINAGQVARYLVNIKPVGGFNQSVSFTCSGQPNGSICSVDPSSAASNGLSSPVVSVSVPTTAGNSTAAVPVYLTPSSLSSKLGTLPVAICAICMVSPFRLRGSRWSLKLRIVGVLLLSTFCPACSGGGDSTGGGQTGTGSGNYTISVKGNAGSISHTVNLTLNVK